MVGCVVYLWFVLGCCSWLFWCLLGGLWVGVYCVVIVSSCVVGGELFVVI